VTEIPLGFFAASLGLSGLSGMWLFAGTTIGAPRAVGDAIALIAGVVWCVLVVGYLRQGPRRLVTDALDTAAGPLLAAPVMSGLLLGIVLSEHARTAGHIVVIVFLVAGALLSGLLLGQWQTGGLDRDRLGPAIYLAGGGIGWVGTQAAYAIGLHHIAAVFFGIGVFTWVCVSSIVLDRLFYRPRLSPDLIPSMAIELAPPAVAGSAYFVLEQGRPGLAGYAIAGYAGIAVIAQLRLVPMYRGLNFSPSFWSFTFPCAAVATLALRWLAAEQPAGEKAYAWIIVAAASALVAAIAVRTIIELARWASSLTKQR
jgi:tellurite resistance protein